jgi:UDP-N-acetylmuramyl pentapeptide phosphotransferase/UDP-N-acetylglucosamine-1-phosphate transferase
VTVTVALLAGLAAGPAGWVLLRPVLAQPLFLRENYRGHPLPIGAGLGLVVAVVAVQAAYTTLTVLGVDRAADGGFSRGLALGAALGFGLLGLVDDLAGSGARRGFAGHVGALVRGELTTGMLKLAGGGLVALALAGPIAGQRPGAFVVRALVIALAANTANLFDRAPGRVLKVWLLAFAVLATVTRLPDELAGPAVVAGASVALLMPDLRERCMLGDTGANVLGAAFGVGVALTGTTTANLVVLAVLVVLNAASEWVSFSRVIDTVPPLRWLDRLGAPYRR